MSPNTAVNWQWWQGAGGEACFSYELQEKKTQKESFSHDLELLAHGIMPFDQKEKQLILFISFITLHYV